MEWLVIEIAVSFLVRSNNTPLIVPAFVAIAGLHFFPLARLSHVNAHYVTGIRRVTLAGSYRVLKRIVDADSSIAIAAGFILWISALVGLKDTDRPHADEVGTSHMNHP